MSARDAILEAADVLFGDEGFEATTTRRIGDLSGINKALIHYHFKDKEHLWSAVLDRYYDRLSATVRAALVSDGDVRARFRRLVGVYFVFLAENRRFARMVQREIASGRHIERIVSSTLPLFQTGAALFEAAWPAAGSGEMGARHVFVSLYGMVVTWVTHAPVIEGLVGEDPLGARAVDERRRHIERMVDIIATALSSGLESAAAAPAGATGEQQTPEEP